jgi:hydrogenase expression/formation protein HypC
MCLAIPAQIIAIDQSADMATASVDNVRVGDYVLVHVGYALNKIDEDEALKTLALFAEAGLSQS